MGVKDILQAFWKYQDGYDGEIACQPLTAEEELNEYGLTAKDGLTYYAINTDGNEFIAAKYDGDENRIFFRLAGDTSPDAWRNVAGTPTVQIDGKPYEAPMYSGISATDVAEKVGVTVTTIYNYAQELGHIPTVEEATKMRARKKNGGRPHKW